MLTHSKANAPTLPPESEKYLEHTYPSDLPGATVAILRYGEIIHKSACGLADTPRGIPMSIDSVHCIGALTKQFTAAAIMLLNDRKLLFLDDALTTHLSNCPAQYFDTRLKHLMNHTSGVVCCCFERRSIHGLTVIDHDGGKSGFTSYFNFKVPRSERLSRRLRLRLR